MKLILHENVLMMQATVTKITQTLKTSKSNQREVTLGTQGG